MAAARTFARSGWRVTETMLTRTVFDAAHRLGVSAVPGNEPFGSSSSSTGSVAGSGRRRPTENALRSPGARGPPRARRRRSRRITQRMGADLRARLGPEAIVPWFDPADGGEEAKVLWLLEAPGPKATLERGESGIVSCNNNDGTAENTWRTRTEAGVDRAIGAHWNVIPYYLGSGAKIRAWDPSDVRAAGPLLRELLALFGSSVRSIILGGGAGQEAWRSHAPRMPGI